jgi:hypothetical protein
VCELDYISISIKFEGGFIKSAVLLAFLQRLRWFSNLRRAFGKLFL